jgi:ABC-type branched-subunit amino acid transport system substrate-binding protein
MTPSAQVAQYFITGITIGCIYALVAIGFNIIFNATGIINLAQGESGTGSDAMMLAFEGLRRGNANPAKIRDSVENVKNLVGFHGIFNMSPQDHNGLDKKDTIMIQIKNGQFLPLYY